ILMHQVLETGTYPTIRFTLDSLVGLTKQPDGIVGSAVGTLMIRGVAQPITAALKVFPDAGGMRVLAKWRMPADTLLRKGCPKLRYLGLGANTHLWHDFFMGADLVCRTYSAVTPEVRGRAQAGLDTNAARSYACRHLLPIGLMLRTIVAGMLIVTLTSCTTWTAVTISPASYIRMHDPESVWLQLRDNSTLVLGRPRVVGDTLRGINA